MKFTIQKSVLLGALQRVFSAVDQRSDKVILQHVLLQVSDQALTLKATDLKIELAYVEQDLSVEQVGEIAIPAKKLLDVLKALPDEPLTLSQSASKAVLKQGKREFSFQTVCASTYPDHVPAEYKASVSLTSSALKAVLKATSFSMANDDVRYQLNGLSLEAGKSGLVAAATDGFRLSVSQAEISDFQGEERQVIVPRNSALSLVSLLPESDQGVVLQMSQNVLTIKIGTMVLTTKLIDGKFPDYTKMLGKETEVSLTVNRLEFKGACQRMSALSNAKTKGIRLALSANALALSSSNPEHDEAKESMDAAVSLIGNLEVGFNATYLIDILSAIATDEVVMKMPATGSVAVLQGVGAKAGKYVVMPMRL